MPGSAKLFYDAGEGAVEVPLTDLGGGSFEASIGATACGGAIQYYVTAQSSTGVTWVDPPNGGMYGAVSTLATWSKRSWLAVQPARTKTNKSARYLIFSKPVWETRLGCRNSRLAVPNCPSRP